MRFGTVLVIRVTTLNNNLIEMTIIYFLVFFMMVIIFAIITHRLNNKAKCSHDWADEGEGVVKCSKCNKCISTHTYENNNEQIAA
jgi:preprotein translocase subunit SecG